MTNDAESTAPVPGRRRWFHLSPETIAIVTVGIALATLMLTTANDIRDEARAARVAWEKRTAEIDAAWKAESRQIRDSFDARARADREAWEAEARAIRAENRAAREAWEAESRHFQREILNLTAEIARLSSRDRDTTAELERPTAGTTATTEPATVDRDRSRPMPRPGPLHPS